MSTGKETFAPPASHPPRGSSDRAVMRTGLLVSIATGVFQYLNSWIRLALIPGDVEYHVRQFDFQHAVHVTLLNSLLAALVLAAMWVLGMRLRNSRIAETLHFFVLAVLAITIFRSILLVIPATGSFAVDFGNFWVDALACAVAIAAQRLVNFGPAALVQATRIAAPVSVASIAMLAALIFPVLFSLGRERSPAGMDAPANAMLASGRTTSGRVEHVPRILWVIFDEFDASVAFENRPASMKLPHIDRFRREAVSFRHAVSPSAHTVTAIPSLLTGISFSGVARKRESDLVLTVTAGGKEYSFRETPNVIDWANAAGVPVTIVGWTHPYCRIFGSKLAQCAWFENPYMSRAQTWATTLQSLSWPKGVAAQMWQEARGATADPCDQTGLRNLTAMEYEGIRSTLRSIVANQRAKVREFLRSGVGGLQILHLATPHPPGNGFSPASATSRNGEGDTSFVANYSIADSIFGEIRAILEERGEWDSTLVILTSDHGLRSFWEEIGCMSNEDRQMLAHRNELSVPLMLKWPGGGSAASVEEPVSTLILAPLVHAYLRREIRTHGEFNAYLEQEMLRQAETQLAERRLSR
ncbi:MAG: sulfatase-like hydrolase/transferase [Bryobacterales bacterium]|nr:sulfatase-like hydrolase/transferase [Bryobacterales bacterium]